MRFWTHLLLLLACFAAGFGITRKWIRPKPIEHWGKVTNRLDDAALAQVGHLTKGIESAGFESTDVGRINAWLSGEVSGDDSFLSRVSVRLRVAPTDPWERPYKCAYLAESDSFGIYSNGPDGTSSSLGNDLDDLNTWRGAVVEYWERGDSKTNLIVGTCLAVFIYPIVCGLLWSIARVFGPGRRG